MSPAVDTAHGVIWFFFVFFSKLFPNSWFDLHVGRDIFLTDAPHAFIHGRGHCWNCPSPSPPLPMVVVVCCCFLIVAWPVVK